jgi:hypothetical protein
MNSIVNKYNIYINSAKRISGTSDNFSIQLEKPLTLTSDKTQFQLYVSSLEYPYNFYQVNSNNNSLTLEYTPASGPLANYVITITPGNYNINSLLSELKTKTSIATGVSETNFNFSYSRATGRCTFALSTLGTITYKFSSNTFIGKMCGFTADSTFSFASSSTSSQNVNVNPITYFTIRSDIVLSNQDMESITKSSENSDILCKVPIRTPPGTYIYYAQPFDDRVFISAQVLNVINFYITSNQNKELIDNHGLDFSFTLTILEVVKPDGVYWNKLGNFDQPIDVNELQKQQQQLIEELQSLQKQA